MQQQKVTVSLWPQLEKLHKATQAAGAGVVFITCTPSQTKVATIMCMASRQASPNPIPNSPPSAQAQGRAPTHSAQTQGQAGTRCWAPSLHSCILPLSVHCRSCTTKEDVSGFQRFLFHTWCKLSETRREKKKGKKGDVSNSSPPLLGERRERSNCLNSSVLLSLKT